MIIIFKFDNTVDVMLVTDFSFDNGHILISNQDFTLLSENEFSKEQFTYFAWSLYHNCKLDLSNYSFVQVED